MDQKELKGTGTVQALGLTLHLRKGEIGVDDHLDQHFRLLLHGWDCLFELVDDCGERSLEVVEQIRSFLGDSGDLLNFYFFILFVVKEGEVEGLVSSVDVGVDELEVPDQVHQKVAPLSAPEGLRQYLDVFAAEIAD